MTDKNKSWKDKNKSGKEQKNSGADQKSSGTAQRTSKVLITAEQIQKRIGEIGRQISEDFAGKTIYAVCVLENGFMFMADLVRAIKAPVVCQFIKPETSEKNEGGINTTEIVFSPEVSVGGQHVLLVEALIQSGVTSEFLMRNLMGRGALSVKLAGLLDKQSARRVSLQPDYFGFLLDESFVMGYGLGSPLLGRNLPYIAVLPAPPATGTKA